MPNDSQHLIDRFRTACKPPGVFELTEIYISLALQELHSSKTQPEKYSSALRLLCCIPAIADRLSDSAMNEVFGRQGIELPSDG